MDETRIAQIPAPFTLHREGTEEPISEHQSAAEGWEAGQAARNADPNGTFVLSRGPRPVMTPVARFHGADTLRKFDADLTAALALGAT